MTREEVLAELEILATVEHALIVEYLTVHCALGHDLDPDEGGASAATRDAADAAFGLAGGEMTRLASVFNALIGAGRFAPVERAASIASASHPAIPLDPPNAAQLERLVEREEAIAKAVDERYARLVPAVAAEDDLRPVVEDGQTHAAAVAPLRAALGDLAPAAFLRATRRETSDAFEQRLLDLSVRGYRLVVSVLQERFAPESALPASLPVDAMRSLDGVNRLLVQRGLLPPFTAA
jgi:hypothetical protein